MQKYAKMNKHINEYKEVSAVILRYNTAQQTALCFGQKTV